MLLAIARLGGGAGTAGKTDRHPGRAAERPPLNLKLDNPSSFATIAPAEKKPEPALPTLGGDARKIAPAPESREAEHPSPKDTNPGH